MKILASALVDAAKTYLHAGYISAYPRPLYPEMYYGNGEPTLQLDMVQALQLQGEAAAAALPDGGAAVSTALASGSASMLAAAAAATAGAAGFVVLHRRLGLRPRMAMAAGAVAGLLTAGHFGCMEDSQDQTDYEKSLPAPWEDVELRAYADPEAATQAILHGIIADGLGGVDFRVEELKHIQLEVGLPTSNPSEGMTYALQTYGFDGWGREFRLESGENEWEEHVYTVTSAGADGSFGTDDDIAIHIGESTNESWDAWRWATFLQRDDDGALISLFHRFRGGHFEYNHEADAQALTNTELFDLFDEDDLQIWIETLEGHYDAAAAEVEHDPVLLQVYRETS
jgi:hypothetical protein